MAEIPFEPYTGQSKLRFWCQKVLPLVYDDSLSYYELLGKVVEYLNNTITDVSACEDNITALRDAFVQLQDYVNEQLEDFAPEVEQIIDEMIESGEFGEILADTVNGLIANEYSTTQGYAQFDYVIKDGKLYCATASTSGEWDVTKWRETTVGADMQLLNQRVYNLNAGQVAYNSEGTYNNATVGKELQELKGSLNTLPANRLKGKKIALYGDSWSTSAYGSLGREYIESITGVEMHVSALGSQTMAQIYSGLWDSYNADIYIIEGGLNDKSLNVGGTPFINAIHNIVNAIRKVNSNAEIYFVTPPKTKTAQQYNALFPLEFYRIVIWRLAAIDGFNVINALKWTDINLRNDLVHPTANSEEKIGKHIVQALINYGDEETHIQEFSNLNSAKANQILFFCSNGDMEIKLQNYESTADAANNVNQSLGNIDTIFAATALPIVNGASGSSGLFMYDNISPNHIRFYVNGMAQGARFTGGSGFLPVKLQAVSYTGG